MERESVANRDITDEEQRQADEWLEELPKRGGIRVQKVVGWAVVATSIVVFFFLPEILSLTK